MTVDSDSRESYSFLLNRRCSLAEEEVGTRENVTRQVFKFSYEHVGTLFSHKGTLLPISIGCVLLKKRCRKQHDTWMTTKGRVFTTVYIIKEEMIYIY